jgi:hypothetical protein
MDTILNKFKKREVDNSNDSWTTIVRKKRDNKGKIPITKITTADPERTISCVSGSSVPNISCTRIKFTEALSLPAIKVPSFEYVKSDGELYYVESADHFAFKLAGKLLHGNIGNIYTDEKNPEKIKNCKFAASCMKRDHCDYYHDPLTFAGSKDYRNFIASSFVYSPPNSEYKNRTRGRRFGSREHLDTDIVGLNEEEISRFCDQTVHDILCSLLLNNMYSAT